MSDCDPNDYPQFKNDSCEYQNDDTAFTIQHTHEYPDNRITHHDYEVNNNSDQRSEVGEKRHPSIGIIEHLDLCLICESKIYPMEKLNADGKLYHKNCFRCSKCRTILSITNFTINNNSIYCKTHFMELFKMRGKFDDDENIQHEIITGTDTEDIPTIDTKGLLAKFRELESGSTSTPQPSYVIRRNSTQRYMQTTDDVVKCDDLAPDDLPPPETAKAMVAKFKAMESDQNVPSPVCVEKMKQKAKANSTPNANVRLQSGSIPAHVNEDDYNKEELPEEGTTKNLMSIFQNLHESN